MLTIINYGLGNIQAFGNVYNSLNIPFRIASTSSDLTPASKLILPGVGSFDWAMEKLNALNINDRLNEMVLVKKIPILGICVGMQMMAMSSEEGSEKGLGWIEADVLKFRSESSIMLPHMGWNDVKAVNENTLLQGIYDTKFYFLHSYHVNPRVESLSIGQTTYGMNFTSIIGKENIYGVQFHPEKSHNWGSKLLKNFAEL